MRVFVKLFLFLFLASCGRPLTQAEMDFVARMHGSSVDPARIRVVDGALVGSVTHKRQKRPRLACRERIFPEPTSELVTVSPSAVVLHNKIFYARDWYLDDYLLEAPEKFDLFSVMVFAHEMTHVWQWQNRKVTGYSPLRAAREHGGRKDPYLFDIGTKTRLLDYAYEQQASIVEEYVCCEALDPKAPRTNRLRALLSDAFPLNDLEIPDEVLIPWDGAKIEGICR